VVTVGFILTHQAPGGPFDAERAVPAEVWKNLEQKYRLDQPMYL
jgi:oligopeptide transport system permease protein